MQARLKQLGLTPAKGALIAGLMLLLAVIWGPQVFSWGGSSSSAPPRATARLSTSKSPSRRPSPRVGIRKSRRNALKGKRTLPATVGKSSSFKREIPVITASAAGAYDPFKVPSWSPAAAMIVERSLREEGSVVSLSSEEEVEERASSLRRAGVAMILVSSTGQMAKIGDQTVQVGDEIDGFRVMEITAEGVVLQPNKSNTTSEEVRDESPSSL